MNSNRLILRYPSARLRSFVAYLHFTANVLCGVCGGIGLGLMPEGDPLSLIRLSVGLIGAVVVQTVAPVLRRRLDTLDAAYRREVMDKRFEAAREEWLRRGKIR